MITNIQGLRRITALNVAQLLARVGQLASILHADPHHSLSLLRIGLSARDYELTASDGAMRAARSWARSPHRLICFEAA